MPSSIRIALRSLRKTPTYTLTALATLAAGIGSTVALLAVVRAVLLEPLPYPEPERLVVVWTRWTERDLSRVSHTGNDFREYQRRSRLFEGIAAVGSVRQNLTSGSEPSQVQVGWVSENFFSVLGTAPLLGRAFREDEPPGSVILGYGLWQSHFGGDGAILGRKIELDRTPYVVVGVMPKGFRLWMAPDVGISMEIDLWKPPDPIGNPGRWQAAELDQSTLRIVGRLPRGVSFEQVQAEMDEIAAALRAAYPDHERAGFHLDVRPLHEEIVGYVRQTLHTLLGAVGLVLLVACANVGCLTLVRARGRTSEVAVRVFLGASPGRVVAASLIESLALALGGGVLGIGLGSLLLRILRAFPSRLPRIENAEVDGAVLAVTLALTLGATLLSGLVPAVHTALSSSHELASRRETAGRRSRRTIELLVVAEIALSLVLLVGSGLLLRSFLALQAIRPGFDAEGLLTFSISLPSADYAPPVETAGFLKRFEERIASLPGVVSVGAVWPLPLEGQKWFGYYRTLDRAVESDTLPVGDFRLSSPGYLQTMGAKLLDGRYPREEDTDAVLVDETLARTHWPDGTAVGQSISVELDGGPLESRIVGVVENIRHAELTKDGRPTIYLPARGFTWADWELALVVRTGGDPRDAVAPVRSALAELDPRIPMAKVRAATEYLDDATAPNRLALLLASSFAAMALLLSAVGLYGVMAYQFEQRSREMGIRMAFGAGRSRILTLVLGRGLALGALGIGIGTIATLPLRRVLTGLLFGVDPSDPWTQAATVAVLLTAAAFGSLGPALRSVRVDPAVALRAE
jgi:predicted permease